MSDDQTSKQGIDQTTADGEEIMLPMAPDSEKKNGESGGHAMNYMLELFLDDNNYVYRTTILHVQSGQEESWDNWDQSQLLTFFKRRPELRLTKILQVAETIESGQDKKPLETRVTPLARTASPSPTSIGSKTRAGEKEATASKSFLRKLDIISAISRIPSRSVDHNQGFNVRLHLDLAQIMSLGQGPFDYTVSVLAKSMSSQSQQSFIKDQGTITSGKNMTLNLYWPELAPGVYRISAALTLSIRDTDAASQRDLSASLEGGLFRVS
ncbi:MAG: hypothetical protein L0226_08740 [Acidobacteria bacterium]|nr:hypothetical protein [Acidobacteriota bacterium]